jgi:hypothetical protein
MLITNKVLKELKEGLITREEVVNELINTYSIKAIVEDYVNLVMETPGDNVKITVSQEEYESIVSLFKIRGKKVDGETETRGRKRKR